MKRNHGFTGNILAGLGSFLVPLFLFWVVLLGNVPHSVSRFFHTISWEMFFILLVLYYLSFKLPGRVGGIVYISLTMVILALSLSYRWTSGFSDNALVGGLLPYKDAKNYYISAQLILSGLPPGGAAKYILRPLFPGFMASMLTLSGQNLKFALAFIVQLTGFGIVLAARQVRSYVGALGAGFYIVCLLMYFLPWVGYTMSETLGLTLGCVSLAVLLLASKRMKSLDFVLGFFVLLLALLARAGTFFILPMLALWIGWIFGKDGRLSVKLALYTAIGFLMGYLLINGVYSRLLDVPSGNSFGNFSYTIYGQVTGGAGWYSAITDLGTNKPSIIYREAWRFFLDHPMSLVIGIVKSYRDFFFDGNNSVVPFSGFRWENWPGIIIWAGMFFLLLRGLFLFVRNVRSAQLSLLVAGFVGIFLSIPFLPPIDGGTRFYASTIPFLFALQAVGLGRSTASIKENLESDSGAGTDLIVSRLASVCMVVLSLVVPPLVYLSREQKTYNTPDCRGQGEPFVINVYPDSYINLVKTGLTGCGPVPGVCLSDFQTNNTEITTDDFYQNLIALTEKADGSGQVIPAVNLVDGKSHYFYVADRILSATGSNDYISGCADQIKTQYQSIYRVDTILP